jgi:hypothetical protein
VLLLAGTLLAVWLATPGIERLRLIMRAKLGDLLERARLQSQPANIAIK